MLLQVNSILLLRDSKTVGVVTVLGNYNIVLFKHNNIISACSHILFTESNYKSQFVEK